jgi:hypothetical protein
MEQLVNTKLLFNWVKRQQKLMKYRKHNVVMKTYDVAVYLNGLNALKTGVRIFRMIQDVGVLQPLEMQTPSQMSVKW